MQCPYCDTDNRDEQESCYHCGKDLTILRLIVNKAKHHFNLALEHAEKGRNYEAINELKNTLDLNRQHTKSWIVLGTLYAKLGDFEKARESWSEALALSPDYQKVLDYTGKSFSAQKSLPILRRLQWITVLLLLIILAFIAFSLPSFLHKSKYNELEQARKNYNSNNYKNALSTLEKLLDEN